MSAKLVSFTLIQKHPVFGVKQKAEENNCNPVYAKYIVINVVLKTLWFVMKVLRSISTLC